MKVRSLVVLALSVFALVVPAGAQVWNLSNDWSESNGNPNGAWTYANGAQQAFPNVVQNFNTPDMGAGQTGWGGIGGAHEGWAKSIGAGPHDFPAGAVGAHGSCRIIWTAPSNGVYTISGGGWMFRHIGRTVTWRIWKNSTELSSGIQNDTTTQFNSATPEPFSNGSGGAAVLTQSLQAGDKLLFGHDDPDFFAYTITITKTTDPTPTNAGPTPTPTPTNTLNSSKTTWNLSADWSETNGNPNDAWAYANGLLQIFPQVVQNFNTPDMGPGQTGWSGIGPGHEGWAKSIGAGPHDFPAGAVGAHGPCRIIWTAPTNGVYTISGGGWMFRHTGRTVTWRIWKNNQELTSGTQNDGTPQFNSTTPEPFSNGSGGVGVLTQSLQAGDRLIFGQNDNDFFAFTITITKTNDPTPTWAGPTVTPTPTNTINTSKSVWNLSADWSETNGNPNDVWTYANGAQLAFPTVVQNFNTPDMGPGQTGWSGIGGAHEGWAKSIGAGPHDFPGGAVGAHGACRIIWTAPKNGTFIITGGGWMFRHIGRTVTWHIWLNNSEITQGTQNDGSPFTSGNPEPWSNGTGGEAVLTQNLQAGDKIMFGHDDGDFFAYGITISLQGQVIPPTNTPLPTRTPTNTIATGNNSKVYKLDSQPSTEYLGVAVGDFNGDGTPDVGSTVKGGAPGVFNDTNIFYLKGIDLETITDPFAQIPNENVYTAGADEGAWFAAAGDFIGNGRSQILINHRADGRATSSAFAIFSRNNTDPPGTSAAWSLAASLPVEHGSAGSFSQTGRFFPGLNRDFIAIGSGMVANFAARVVGLDNAGTTILSDIYAGPTTGNNFRATFLGDISGDGIADLGYWSQNPKFLAVRSYSSGTAGSLVATASRTLWTNGQPPFDGIALPYPAPEIGKEFGPVGRAGKFFVGDPSKDGRKEVLLPLAGNAAANSPGVLLSIQATAATFGGAFGSLAFENEVVDINLAERYTAAVTADLDGDGDEEIIAGTQSGMVYGYVRRDQAPGFTPGSVASVNEGNHYVRFILSGNGLGAATPIGSLVADIGVGDVDNDGKKEIAVSTGYPGGPANVPGTYIIDNISVPPAPPLSTSIFDWFSY